MKKLGLLFFLLPSYVMASSSVGNTKSTATLSSSCVISADTLNFGNYDPSQGDSFSSGTIRIKCTKGTSYGIGMIYSNYGIDNTIKYGFIAIDGNKWINYLTSSTSTDKLKYNIFQDVGLTKIFGNAYTANNNWAANGSSVSVYKTGTGDEQTTTMYGAMAGGQYIKPGNYSVNVGVGVYF